MMNQFGLFFTRDDTVIRLPVNPETLPVKRQSANEDYNVLGLGPIQVPRTPELQVVTISSFFPGRPFPGVLTPNGFRDPEFYLRFFQSAMDDCVPILYTPVRFYESGEPFFTGDTGFLVLVTGFSTEERAGETGDFYYDLELTEYRDYAPLTMRLAADGGAAAADAARPIPAGQLYVGAVCTANGTYYASSYGDGPSAAAAGRRVVVSRIVDAARPYPYHVTTEAGGPLGWMRKSALQVVR